jgi:hypothetical protein
VFRIDPADELVDAILRVVAAQPGISVADLHAALKKKRGVTLQHLYRKVNQLIEEEILIKRKGTLTVNLMWLTYLEYFVSEAKQSMAKNTALKLFPLKKGQRLTFNATTINGVQTLWHHLLVQLHHVAPQSHLYKYYSHAWWVWNKRTLDVAFYKKIYASGVRCLWLYGNNTYLDREAVTMYPNLIESRISLDVQFPEEGYNLNVYGDYVFECIFPPSIARHFELVFTSVTSKDKKALAIVDDVFGMHGDFKITVWHNPALAAKLRKQIGRYFLFGAKVMPEEGEKRN